MKNLFIASLLLASTNVFASKMVVIKTFSNSVIEASASEIGGMDAISHYGGKKVIELKGKGATAQEIRQNAVAQALHTLCPFFDDGVRLVLNSKDQKGSLDAVTDILDSVYTTEEEADYKSLVRTISAVNKEAGVEVYSGSTSGNNTSGAVLGFFDVKNNEIAVFANTNCGSDN